MFLHSDGKGVYFTKAAMVVAVIVAFVAGTLFASYLSGVFNSNHGGNNSKVSSTASVPAADPISNENTQLSYLLVGKNGQELKLTEKDSLQLTSKDEFAIRAVVTTTPDKKSVVEVEGIGKGDDIKTLFKGADLVDKIASTKKQGNYHIKVKIDGKQIASIPLSVSIGVQDWLRYAGLTKDKIKRIEYTKMAYEASNDSLVVRKQLLDAYLKAGIKNKAVQLQKKQAPDNKKDSATTKGAKAPSVTKKLKEIDNLVASKKYLTAVKAYKGLLITDPDNAYTYRYKLGQIYRLMKDTNKEIISYNLSLKQNPDNDDVYMALGEAQERSGSYSAAIDAYRKALSLNPLNTKAKTKIEELEGKLQKKGK